MIEIYDKILGKKLQVGPAEIREHRIGAAFHSHCFFLGCPEVFSRMVVENAKGCTAARSVINSYMECMAIVHMQPGVSPRACRQRHPSRSGWCG